MKKGIIIMLLVFHRLLNYPVYLIHVTITYSQRCLLLFFAKFILP